MSSFSKRVHVITGLAILAVLFTGCAPTLPYHELDPTQRQSLHQTEFVIITHPGIRYYWEISQNYGTYHNEIRRDKIGEQPIQWQKKMDYELGLVEAYLTRFQDPSTITQEIYFRTLQKVLTGNDFLLLRPYSGPAAVNDFEQIETGEIQLPYDIPIEADGAPPDWYLVMEVDNFGLKKRGISTMSGSGTYGATSPIDLLAGFIADVIVTATINLLTPKTWVAFISGDIMLVDANTSIILWKSDVSGQTEVPDKIEQLVLVNPDAFPGALVEAVAQAAAKNAISLKTNQYVGELEPTMTDNMLDKSERALFIDHLIKTQSE